MANNAIKVGTRIVSIHGEMSCVENGEEVQTGPMAEGLIDSLWVGQEDCYSLAFPCGVSVFLNANELADASSYTVLN